jgi:hypothetical protein
MLITEGTIYTLHQGRTQMPPSIIITGGTVNIYVSNKATRPTSTSDSSWELDVANAQGNYYIVGTPKYIYIENTSGTHYVDENNLLGGLN